MADLVGATNSLRSELQFDGQLSFVLLGSSKYWIDPGCHYRRGGAGADGFECARRQTSRDCQQYFYDWQTCADAYFHRLRPLLSQPSCIRVGSAAINRRVLAVRSVVALRVHRV